MILRCVICSCLLDYDSCQVKEGVLRCNGCGGNYPILEGIPFMGRYSKTDINSLMEIAAVAANAEASRDIDFTRWENICENFHETGDELAVQAELKNAHTYFSFRYNEWLLFRGLLRELDLQDKTVLDVGAGAGFDASRLVRRGARVTALEYNPRLAAVGKHNLPEATWIGGFSHLLPFQDDSFDMVMCNAALHHMRDIPAAMEEFLRVLKPSGWMITACDSFMSDACSDRTALDIFDEQPDVLMGVNEQSPRISLFLSTLERHRDAIEVDVFTTVTYNHQDGLELPMTYYAHWDFDTALQKLGSISGSLALRVRRVGSISIEPSTQADGWLAADEFMAMCADRRGAFAFLARHIPEEYTNLPSPHPFHDKFLQLNGWRSPRSQGKNWQEGYGRGNTFLRRAPQELSLEFELEALETGFTGPTVLTVALNGEVLLSQVITRGVWYRILLPATSVPADQIFMATIRIEGGSDFNSRLFRVRRLAFKNESSTGGVDRLGLGTTAGIAALIADRFAKAESLKVLCLPGQENLFKCLSRLRANGIANLRLIAPKNMAWMLAAESGVAELAVYDVTPHGLMQALLNYGPPDLVLLPSAAPAGAAWLSLLIKQGVPIIDCRSDRLVTEEDSLLQGEIFPVYGDTGSLSSLVKQWIKEYLPSPMLSVLRSAWRKIG